MKVWMGKGKAKRRAEAIERMKAYTYKKSRAFRNSTRPEEHWAVRNHDEIKRLSA